MYNVYKADQNEFSQRLKVLRRKKKMTQADLSKALTSRLNGETQVSLQTISSWETGLKMPHISVVSVLCDVLECSVDFILARTSVIDGFAGQKEEALSETKEVKDSDLPLSAIRFEDITDYHGKPVFVSFEDVSLHNQWGLVDKEQNLIRFADGSSILLRSYIQKTTKFSVLEPEFNNAVKRGKAKRISMKTIGDFKQFYVCMKTADKAVHAAYDGWYRHNEDHTFIISDRGYVLPYGGIDLSYHAYTAPVEAF